KTQLPRSLSVATISLLLAPGFAGVLAQEPPPAPVPKVNPPPAGKTPPATAPQDNRPHPVAPSDSQGTLRVNVNLVILPVTVKDGAGRLVADLTRTDFRIFDDEVEQRVEYFSAEAFPLSAVILLDNDLKSKDARQVESSLSAVVAGLSTSDEAFVCRFDTNFHPGKGFTHDQDKLLTELHRTRIDESRTSAPPPAAGGVFTSGPTINGQSAASPGAPVTPGSTTILADRTSKALDDAVFEAAQLLKDRGRDRRKIIFLISDGDNGKTNVNTYGNTVKELLRYDIAVYSIGVGSGYFERKFSRLQSYAHDSGGDTYYAAKRNGLEELYSRVTEQARNQYTLGYNPRGNNRSKEYHTVEVRVRREGLDVRTREGYYSAIAPR
ncbi:MAG TPA: VWA domain-containing protein, partial [Candidatus Acidoferrum sp.]|nr:VWA domain-containing protein [Candidatus Acidoferrum sp.]